MPPLEHMDIREKAVLWEFVRMDRNAMPLVLAPIQISVRWEKEQRDALDKDGQQIVTDVTICSNRDIKLESIIWEGSLEDLAEETNGTAYVPTGDIYQVLTRIRAKDLLQRVTRYEFGIKRFKDRLPARTS